MGFFSLGNQTHLGSAVMRSNDAVLFFSDCISAKGWATCQNLHGA